MLTVVGNIFIPGSSPVEEKKWKSAVYFTFTAVSKHPTQEGKHCYHKVSIYVPDEHVERARQIIKPGEMLFLRHADLDGRQSEQGAVFSEVKTTWNNIEHMVKVPARKES